MKIRILLFILPFIFSYNITAQTTAFEKIEELFVADKDSAISYARNLLNASRDTASANFVTKMYKSLGRLHEKMWKYETAVAYYDSLQVYIKAHPESVSSSQNELAANWLDMAICYNRLQQYDLSLNYLDSSIQTFTQIDSIRSLSNALATKGDVLRITGRYEQSVQALLESLGIKDSIGDNDMKNRLDVLTNLGLSLTDAASYEDGRKHLEQALAMATNLKDSFAIARANLNLAYNIQYLGNYQEALDFTEAAYKIFQELTHLDGMSNCLSNMAMFQESLGQYEEAEMTYQKSVELSEQLGDQEGQVVNYVNLTSFYAGQGQYEKCLEAALAGLKLSRKIGYAIGIRASLENMAEINKLTSNYKDAYTYHVRFKEYSDSLLNETSRKNIEDLNLKYETAEKEKQLAEQALDIQTKEATILQQRNQLLLIIAVSVMLLLGAGLYYQRVRARQRTLLQEAVITEQRKGIEAVFEATEEERKRIAKDLHDGVGQQLSGLKLAFQNFLGVMSIEKEAEEQADKILKIVDESANDVRSISHQMMPRTLMELGLVPAMEDSLEKYLGSTEIRYEFDHHGVEDRLPERIEVSIYRIFQELINNIIKHSGASQVSVQLVRNAGKLILTVEDNGKGFMKGSNDGHGMWTIKNRLDPISGKFSYEPGALSGTAATVMIPLMTE